MAKAKKETKKVTEKIKKAGEKTKKATEKVKKTKEKTKKAEEKTKKAEEKSEKIKQIEVKKSKKTPPKSNNEKLWKLIEENYMGMDSPAIQESFARHMEYTQAKTRFTATEFDCYKSIAYSVVNRLMERWNDTQRAYYEQNTKRVYYLSLEYLMGRALGNNLINLGMEKECYKALYDLGYELEELMEFEPDAGLGNGGLGRLAACFLDSIATLQLPGSGYGIRYEYGIFSQKIENGRQIEKPDNWLRFGNPWEIVRPEYTHKVEFYGQVNENFEWVNTNKVSAVPYDTPVAGYKNNTVNTLRLWSAKAEHDFALECFNKGDYINAVQEKITNENITKVLYPKDDISSRKRIEAQAGIFLCFSNSSGYNKTL